MSNSIYSTLYPELSAAIKNALAFIWREHASSLLGRKWLPLIKEPAIILVENVKFLGRFSYNDGPVIELSADLIRNHSWGAVVDVFLHETAHQLTLFLHPEQNFLPHGKEFREICAALGANPDATAEEISLDDAMKHPTGQGSTMIDKLKKLLTLAEKGDANEAEVALAKAMELMAKYGLTEEDAASKNEFVTITFTKPQKRTDAITMQATLLIENYWGVSTVRTYQPDPFMPDEYMSVYTMSGLKSKVTIAQYVYDYIMNNMELAYKANKSKLSGRMAKRDFCLGYLQGIKRKLEKTAATPEMQALIHKGDAETQEYVRAHYCKLHTARGGHLTLGSAEALLAGREAGKNLDINPGIGIGKSNHYLTE